MDSFGGDNLVCEHCGNKDGNRFEYNRIGQREVWCKSCSKLTVLPMDESRFVGYLCLLTVCLVVMYLLITSTPSRDIGAALFISAPFGLGVLFSLYALSKGVSSGSQSKDDSNSLACYKCGNVTGNNRSLSFLGLRKVRCCKCSYKSVYPMTVARSVIYLPFLLAFANGAWELIEEGGIDAAISIENAPILLIFTGLSLAYILSFTAFIDSKSEHEQADDAVVTYKASSDEVASTANDKGESNVETNSVKAPETAPRIGLLVPALVITIAGLGLYLFFSNQKTYDDCIIENMKGINNTQVAAQVMRSCKAKYGK